jgi:REP element-mobilizing transposase RayT
LFGDVVNGEMKWNDARKIADECWMDIPKHFPNSVLHHHIVMPNHIHGIIELKDVANVGIQHFEPLPNQQNEFQKNNSPFYWFN